MIMEPRHMLPASKWWSAQDMADGLGISRASAYALLRELPEAAKRLVIAPRPYQVGRADLLRALWARKHPRGNPRFADSAYQSALARRRRRRKSAP